MTAPRILETVLYTSDLDAAERFYTTVVGLDIISRFGDAIAFRTDNGVLLVFDAERSRSAERSVPPHGAEGQGHVAFAVEADEMDLWRDRLVRHDVPVVSEMSWPGGGRSVYFRDPAGNLIELAPPGLWD